MLITGGEEATPHEYPWMAALFFEQGAGNTYFCGGTLVNAPVSIFKFKKY